MKEYNEVKRAVEEALIGLIRTVYENLKEDEAENLLMELSLSLFTATLDFSLPVNDFLYDAQMKSIDYQITLKNNLIEAKDNYDKGDMNEFDTL